MMNCDVREFSAGASRDATNREIRHRPTMEQLRQRIRRQPEPLIVRIRKAAAEIMKRDQWISLDPRIVRRDVSCDQTCLKVCTSARAANKPSRMRHGIIQNRAMNSLLPGR